MKKVLLILAYPFILIYSLFSFPFKVAYIIIGDIIKRGPKKTTGKNIKDTDFLGIGNLLYADYKDEFQEYYNLYLNDVKQFHKKFQTILQTQSNKSLNPVEALHSFGDFKQKIGFIDWKGEENEYEIETFIETQLAQKINWTSTSLTKSPGNEKLPRDGEFIIELFKAIDKDLQDIDTRLLFFDMGWDAYVFMPLKQKVYDKILAKAPNDFQGVNDL